jgi:hypothetical protein
VKQMLTSESVHPGTKIMMVELTELVQEYKSRVALVGAMPVGHAAGTRNANTRAVFFSFSRSLFI